MADPTVLLSDMVPKLSVGVLSLFEMPVPASDSVGAVTVATVGSDIESLTVLALALAPMVVSESVSVSVALIELIESDSVSVPPVTSVSRIGVQTLLPAASMAQMR